MMGIFSLALLHLLDIFLGFICFSVFSKVEVSGILTGRSGSPGTTKLVLRITRSYASITVKRTVFSIR